MPPVRCAACCSTTEPSPPAPGLGPAPAPAPDLEENEEDEDEEDDEEEEEDDEVDDEAAEAEAEGGVKTHASIITNIFCARKEGRKTEREKETQRERSGSRRRGHGKKVGGSESLRKVKAERSSAAARTCTRMHAHLCGEDAVHEGLVLAAEVGGGLHHEHARGQRRRRAGRRARGVLRSTPSARPPARPRFVRKDRSSDMPRK